MDVGAIATAIWQDAEKIIAALALLAAWLGYRATTETFRQKNSLEVQRRINDDPKIDEWLKLISKAHKSVLRGETKWEELALLVPNSDAPDTVRATTNWLNVLEELAVGIRHGVYSEQILYDTTKGMVINTWKITRPFVQVRQLEKASSYEWFTWLGLRWISKHASETPNRLSTLKSRDAALAAAYKQLDKALRL